MIYKKILLILCLCFHIGAVYGQMQEQITEKPFKRSFESKIKIGIGSLISGVLGGLGTYWLGTDWLWEKEKPSTLDCFFVGNNAIGAGILGGLIAHMLTPEWNYDIGSIYADQVEKDELFILAKDNDQNDFAKKINHMFEEQTSDLIKLFKKYATLRSKFVETETYLSSFIKLAEMNDLDEDMIKWAQQRNKLVTDNKRHVDQALIWLKHHPDWEDALRHSGMEPKIQKSVSLLRGLEGRNLSLKEKVAIVVTLFLMGYKIYNEFNRPTYEPLIYHAGQTHLKTLYL